MNSSSIATKYISIVALILSALASIAKAQQAGVAEAEQRKLAVERGLKFLQEKGQAADGTFTAKAGPGITALAVTAALRNGRTVDDPMVAKGLKALEGFVKPDGGIYGRLRNYETSVSVVCFDLANKDGRYQKILDDADKFLHGLQYGADGNKEQSDPWFGGVGYGGPERPDLSNTSYLVDALKACDKEGDDAAIQRALVFVSRCQNLKSEYNDTKFAGLVNDGGFYYMIPTENVDPSESERYTENGGLRSEGSMTYSGFKSLIYAGLTKEDPRVKAALGWIKKNYTVEKNPGQGDAGIYYYYNAFASALKASRLDEIADEAEKAHNWRDDLSAELAKRQQADGSWTNKNRQWFENDPNLATSFALIALSYCEPPKPAP